MLRDSERAAARPHPRPSSRSARGRAAPRRGASARGAQAGRWSGRGAACGGVYRAGPRPVVEPLAVESRAMQYRQLGRSGLAGQRDLARLLAHLRRDGRRRRTRARSSRRARARHQPLRHGRRLRERRGRGVAARGAARRRAPQGRDRHQGVLPDVATTSTTAASRASTSSRASRRRCAGSAPTTSTSTSVTAPTRPMPIDETVRAYEDLIRAGQGALLGRLRVERRADRRRACARADAAARLPRRSRTSRSTRCCAAGSSPKVLPACKREGLGQIVWSPLAQGVLTGKYAAGGEPAGTRAAHPFQSQPSWSRSSTRGRARARRAAAADRGRARHLARASSRSPGACAKPNVASAIVGATTRGADRGEREGLGRRASRPSCSPASTRSRRRDGAARARGCGPTRSWSDRARGALPAAARLAEAGFEVLVLEAGPRFSAADFLPDEALMTARLGRTRATASGAQSLYAGACVGGSTVVNDALCWRPPPELLERWRREHALSGLTEAAFAPYVDRRPGPTSTPSRRCGRTEPQRPAAGPGARRLGWRAARPCRATCAAARTSVCATSAVRSARSSRRWSATCRAPSVPGRGCCRTRR